MKKEQGNIEILYHSELQDTLDITYSVPERPAIYVVATFGVGKTHAMRVFAQRKAKELGLEFSEDFNDINDVNKFCLLVFVVHQYDEAELKGLPFPNKARDKTIYLPTGIMPIAGQGIIFLDEINLARKGVQNNCFQLVQDRRLGFYKVPDGYMVTAAGNLDSDRSNTHDMPLPLLDRFTKVELATPPVHDVETEHIDDHGNKVKEVFPGWANDYAIPNKVDNRVIYYLMYQPADLHTYDPKAPIADDKPGTPRSWKKVSDMLKVLPPQPSRYKEHELIRRTIAMQVGRSRATKFIAFLKLSEAYDVSGIYKGEDFELPREVDVLYSLTSALVSYYLERLDAKSATRLVEVSGKFRREHQIMMLSQARKADEQFIEKVKSTNTNVAKTLTGEVFKILANLK